MPAALRCADSGTTAPLLKNMLHDDVQPCTSSITRCVRNNVSAGQ